MKQRLRENPRYAHWAHIRAAFTPDECARVVRLFASFPQSSGRLSHSGYDPASRVSTVAWLPRRPATDWIYERMDAAVGACNEYHYGFDITGLAELQLTHYGCGGFFRWHTDLGSGRSSRRKISAVVQLSDPSTYVGGELELRTEVDFLAPRGHGDVSLFPSYMHHRVRPVARGQRFSLVAWAHGPPFR